MPRPPQSDPEKTARIDLDELAASAAEADRAAYQLMGKTEEHRPLGVVAGSGPVQRPAGRGVARPG
jgi:hypothetical protein